MKRWWPWLIALVVAAIIQVAFVMLASAPEPVVGRWQATSPVALSSLPPLTRDGHTVSGSTIVYFWATWCEPCVRHMPETLALATATGTRVWLVARDEHWHTVVRFFEGKVPPSVIHDAGLGAALGVSVLPTSFYVTDGHVRARSLDALTRTLIDAAPQL